MMTLLRSTILGGRTPMQTTLQALLFLLFCPVADAYEQAQGILAFPVVVSDSSPDADGVLASGESAFTQQVRSASGARLTSGVSVSVRADNSNSVEVPTGTLLVEARDRGSLQYCVAVAARRDGWLNNFDTGICFRDSDRDGRFDQVRTTRPESRRIRNPYEVAFKASDSWAPANVPYVQALEQEMPLSTVRVTYQFQPRGLMRFTDFVTVRAILCWSPELLADTGGPPGVEPCATLASFGANGRMQLGILAVDSSGDGPTPVRAGQVGFTIDVTHDGVARVSDIRALQVGRSLLVLAGYGRSSDPRTQLSGVYFANAVAPPDGTDLGAANP